MFEFFSKYFSPPDDTIKSARDWLQQPPTSANLLKFIANLGALNVTVVTQSRIALAWACEEKEDITYVEVLLPANEEVFPEVHITEKIDTVEGTHKLTRFLVPFAGYEQLIVQQKHQLEGQKLNAIDKALIGRIDKDHFKFFTTNIPQEMHDIIKKDYLEKGLLLNCDNTESESLIQLVEQHQNKNLGA
ncbi:hypothetical protein T440DRAFT_559235 [Plenodomus tracheiphilus IPT5]|uniref:Uncharacterized protein n=1 Tax=Plenodomus tracheiphilus IPT5 TaxID=1408161 RepID=A0A6A7AQK7_9PLEO|nr:hypothetical protein T440DRAFT_559235 [Plenodomus tracheiphilus IPT5]